MNAESMTRVAGRNSRLAAALLVALACAVILLVAGCYSAQQKRIDDMRSERDAVRDKLSTAIEAGASADVVADLRSQLADLERELGESEEKLSQDKSTDKETIAAWIALLASIVLPIAGRRGAI